MLKPTYLRTILILHGLILTVVCMYYLESVLVPFAFAALLAILLNPVNNWLQRRLPKLVAITSTVLLALLVVAGLLSFLSIQISQFADSVPQLRKRLNEYSEGLQSYLSNHYHLSSEKQVKYLNQGLEKALSSGGDMALSTLSAVGNLTFVVTIIPVYVFLLLLYKPLLLEFIKQLFAGAHKQRVAEILQEVKQVVQSYISGLLIEAAIVSALNIAGLFALGIPYAILLGLIGGILNIVPYLGGIVAIALPMVIALITKQDGLTSALLVVAVYGVIQFLDNNIIQPRIVASKVRINALFSVVAVLAFGGMWGVGGMFLAIPFVAVLKIVFDRVEDLQPWGMVLGDENPGDNKPSLNKAKKTVVD